ncbi:MAG: 30S ribosomal protein S2 [Gammaproteobacteria bacterium]|nr:30S ribosomal protein S2 [Gammaproteobacteria bacterium]MDD9863478.1 30S ribosomal protein S2 [Gammaproteobacteria bacterium]
MTQITMREMIDAGMHFGHQACYWHPKMAPYLYGERNRLHIIDLEKTLPLYREALVFLGKVAARKGVVLFVGTKRVAQAAVAEEAARCGMPYVNQRWLGGLLTNFRIVRKSIDRLREYTAQEESEAPAPEKMTKKERLRHQRALDKLRHNFEGVQALEQRPDALFVIDVNFERIAVREARRTGVPVVGVVDSNSDPDGIDYVIPGNDDSGRAVRLYLRGVADAILEAQRREIERAADADEFTEVSEGGGADAARPVNAAGAP